MNLGGAALTGVALEDDVTLDTVSATGAFADNNVGASKPLNMTGLIIGGGDAGNYTLTQPTSMADITPAPLTITVFTVV